mgnify:CR=1 FL=1
MIQSVNDLDPYPVLDPEVDLLEDIIFDDFDGHGTHRKEVPGPVLNISLGQIWCRIQE